MQTCDLQPLDLICTYCMPALSRPELVFWGWSSIVQIDICNHDDVAFSFCCNLFQLQEQSRATSPNWFSDHDLIAMQIHFSSKAQPIPGFVSPSLSQLRFHNFNTFNANFSRYIPQDGIMIREGHSALFRSNICCILCKGQIKRVLCIGNSSGQYWLSIIW